MQKKEFDIFELMKKAFAEFRDRDLWIKTAGSMIVPLVAFAAVAVLFGTPAIYFWSKDESGKLAAIAILAIGTALGFGVAVVLGAYVWSLSAKRAMEIAKVKTIAPKPIDVVLLGVKQIFVNAFCWYDKKLLAPTVGLVCVSVLFFILAYFQNSSENTQLAALGMVAGFGMLSLAFIAYIIAVNVHAYRTFFALNYYLAGEGAALDMPRKSYDMVNGQTLEVFISLFVPQFAAGLVIQIAIQFVMMPLSVLMLFPLGIIIALPLMVVAYLVMITAELAYLQTYNARLFRHYAGIA